MNIGVPTGKDFRGVPGLFVFISHEKKSVKRDKIVNKDNKNNMNAFSLIQLS